MGRFGAVASGSGWHAWRKWRQFVVTHPFVTASPPFRAQPIIHLPPPSALKPHLPALSPPDSAPVLSPTPSRATTKGRNSVSSELVGYLVNMWAWGLMSTPMLQTIAAKASADMQAKAEGKLDLREIEVLARIGASGSQSKNCLRDLERHLQEPFLNQALYPFDMPMRSPACRWVVAPRRQEVLLPHAVFSLMYETRRDEFRTRFVGESGALEAFWGALDGGPLVQDNPACSGAHWRSKLIPLGVHGDATPVAGIGKAWGKLLDAYAFTSLVCTGATKDMMGRQRREKNKEGTRSRIETRKRQSRT